jgi:hypothetical protein
MVNRKFRLNQLLQDWDGKKYKEGVKVRGDGLTEEQWQVCYKLSGDERRKYYIKFQEENWTPQYKALMNSKLIGQSPDEE